jgi:hypothetical protein
MIKKMTPILVPTVKSYYTGLRHGQKARRWSTVEGACTGRPNTGQWISPRQRKEQAAGEARREKKPRKTVYVTIKGKERLMEKMRQKIDEPKG